MISTPGRAVAAAAGAALLVLVLTTSAGATSPRRDFQPHAITGAVIKNGANGAEQTLMCPPDENVLGGGFTVSAQPGRHLDATPTDVLASRPTTDATGWIVAVHKSTLPTQGSAAEPADLTLQVVCTEGETTPGG
ncbi:hypothetical protein [Streptacidiphilus sp. MAP5-3]|uniref:hypothetical protein n=1 Tax=unclassified Streptacidiphilus TaxID=2643834 RepID=UPI003515673C